MGENLKKSRTVKLYIRVFLVFIVLHLFFSSFVHATKMARTQIADLLDTADTVAVVIVESSILTNYKHHQVHSLTSLSLVEHKVRIVEPIKNSAKNTVVSVLATVGLRVGQKYLVFLSVEGNNVFHVMINNYGAIAISYVTINHGVKESARVAGSFIELPNSIHREKGMTGKRERATYVWAN